MVYAYIRFSTSAQEETQQAHALKEFTESHGLTIDVIEKDEGVSGGVSYKDRNLYSVIKKLRHGDVLIVTEISRLGRSMGDLNLLITQELQPRKVRLIVTKMGIDLDCANIKAIDQMILYAFSFAAQLEKELIQQRTQSAIDARKEAIATQGGFISKKNRWCKHLGRAKGADTSAAVRASAALAEEKAREWRNESTLFPWVAYQLSLRRPRKEIVAEARALYEKNPEKWGTRRGKPLTEALLSQYAKHCGLPKP